MGGKKGKTKSVGRLMVQASLEEVRALVRTGDLFFFGGRPLGRLIESFTESNQSHVAVAHRDNGLLLLSETKAKGMGITLLTETMEFWPRVWFARLMRMPQPGYVSGLAGWACEKKVPYDYRAILQYYHGTRPPEDTERLYCSEWSAWCVCEGGTPLATIELTPIELAQRAIFEPVYYCLKYTRREGPLEIRDFNTVPALDPPAAVPITD